MNDYVMECSLIAWGTLKVYRQAVNDTVISVDHILLKYALAR